VSYGKRTASFQDNRPIFMGKTQVFAFLAPESYWNQIKKAI
jgi:hypothetical protein